MVGRGFRTGLLTALLASAALGACGQDKASRPRPDPKLIEPGGAAGGEGGAGGAAEPDVHSGGEPAMPGPPLPTMGPPCNGWSQLCDRPYDQICFPATHAAMASSSLLFDHPAQTRSIRQQLDDSIRTLMLEVEQDGDALASCFGDCAEGSAPFQTVLLEIAGYLADNPREVLTLLVDNRVPAPELSGAFTSADLSYYLYTGDGPWPTLGEMIDTHQRLVVFLTDATGAAPGYRSWDIRSTPDGVKTKDDLSCVLTEGPSGAPLALVRHYLVVPREPPPDPVDSLPGYPSQDLALAVNTAEALAGQLELCELLGSPLPNFLAVDFYDTSDVIAAAQRANGLLE